MLQTNYLFLRCFTECINIMTIIPHSHFLFDIGFISSTDDTTITQFNPITAIFIWTHNNTTYCSKVWIISCICLYYRKVQILLALAITCPFSILCHIHKFVCFHISLIYCKIRKNPLIVKGLIF